MPRCHPDITIINSQLSLPPRSALILVTLIYILKVAAATNISRRLAVSFKYIVFRNYVMSDGSISVLSGMAILWWKCFDY